MSGNSNSQGFQDKVLRHVTCLDSKHNKMLWILLLLSIVHTVIGADCNKPLGVGLGDVVVECTAPIHVKDGCKYAGFNTQDAWCSKYDSTTEYIKVSFPVYYNITKVSIRGDAIQNSYATSFLIAFPDPFNPSRIAYIYDNGASRQPKKFKGNHDSTSVASAIIKLRTKEIFVVPYKSQPSNKVCMSIELYGCADSIVDHCAIRNGGCEQICTNTRSGPDCSCKAGYTKSGSACIDINECVLTPAVCTSADRECVNVPGSYKCVCLTGYTDGPNGTCVDINECTTNPNICDPAVSTCQNTEGSYKCICKRGYQADVNGVCRDIDECKDPAACSSVANSYCVNTIGSFMCNCKIGYQKNTTIGQCEDIDECKKTPCDLSVSECVNTIGSYFCNCSRGFQKDESGNCVDINECAGPIDPCSSVPHSVCVNTFGSYQCNCKKGFTRAAFNKCVDIDECTTGTANCDLSRSTCVNLPGTYECKCNTGYEKDASGICQDIDECKQTPRVCDIISSYCVNTIGSYRCDCNPGYVKDIDGTCKPIKCNKFNAPLYGHLSPLECTADHVNFPTKCNIVCNSGYKLTPSSTTYAQCRSDGQWDFEPGKYTPVCVAIVERCPPIAQVPNSVILVAECTTKGASVGQSCRVFCNGGFDLAGQSSINCLATKQYDGTLTGTECVPRPTITCLDDFFTLSLPFGQKEMKLVYTNYETNVPKSSVTSTPSGILDGSAAFPMGTHDIKLTAKSKADVEVYCTFVLRIVDREAPTVNNCTSTNQYFNVIGTHGVITWNAPKFSDNVGLKRVDVNLQNGQDLSATVYFVQYTALDTSGNAATCKFFVHVRAQSCQPDLLPGGAGCQKFNTAGPTSYSILLISPQNKVYYDQSITTVFVSYTCGYNVGVWHGPIGPVQKLSDCVSFVPKQANQSCPANHELSANKLKCLECPQGRRYDATTQKCKPCPIGTYQDQTGQSSCKECPTGTRTTFEGATSSASCSETCLAGYFSTDGLKGQGKGDCRKCPIGSYQPEPGQVSCELCPLSGSTEQEASTKLKQCILAPRIFKETPPLRLIKAKEGETFELSCLAYGIPLPRMRITNSTALPPAIVRGGQKISLLNSQSPYIIGIKLEVFNVTIADSVAYDCVAENNFGNIYNSDRATFTIDVLL